MNQRRAELLTELNSTMTSPKIRWRQSWRMAIADVFLILAAVCLGAVEAVYPDHLG